MCSFLCSSIGINPSFCVEVYLTVSRFLNLQIHYVRTLSVFLSQWDVDTVDQKYRNSPPYTDTRENRISWFVHCLKQLKALNIKSVGLPYQIGCGLAGGDWTTYFEIIQEFARESNIGFFIVRPSFVQV